MSEANGDNLNRLVRAFEREHKRDIKRGHAVMDYGPTPTYPPGSAEGKAWWAGVLAGKRFATGWCQHMAIQAAKCYASANSGLGRNDPPNPTAEGER